MEVQLNLSHFSQPAQKLLIQSKAVAQKLQHGKISEIDLLLATTLIENEGQALLLKYGVTGREVITAARDRYGEDFSPTTDLPDEDPFGNSFLCYFTPTGGAVLDTSKTLTDMKHEGLVPPRNILFGLFITPEVNATLKKIESLPESSRQELVLGAIEQVIPKK